MTLLLDRVVSRIDIVDGPRTNAVYLTDRFLAGPDVVLRLGLHDRHAAGPHRTGLRGVENTAESHIQGAGDDCDVLDPGVPMRHDLEIGWKLQPEHNRHRLIQGPFDDGDLDAWKRGKVLPDE